MAHSQGAVAAMVAAALLGTSVVAGSFVGAHAQDGLNIWYVNPLPNTPDWGRSGKIFQDGAAANGYKATLIGPNKIDIPAMISQIEQAITDGADGIITCPLDPAAFKGVSTRPRPRASSSHRSAASTRTPASRSAPVTSSMAASRPT